MKRYGLALLAVLVAGTLTPADAQQPPADQTVASVRDSVAADIAMERAAGQQRRFSVLNYVPYVSLLGNRSGSLIKLLQRFEDERADKQVGATSSASGTTTLVSKGTAPKILALAVENGAVSQAQSGTTVTFRSNLGGAIRALAGKGYLELMPRNDPAVAVLNKLSVSASFDTSRGETAGTLTADRQQLTQWTARYSLLNQRDPQTRDAQERWNRDLSASFARVSGAAASIAVVAPKDMILLAWEKETADAVERARLQNASADAATRAQAIADALEAAEQRFPLASLLAETRAALGAYDISSSEFAADREMFLARLKRGVLATLEYTNDRPLAGPRLSNIRFVAEAGGTVDITGNAAVTLYESIPTGATKRVKDYQASAQMDIALGSAENAGAFVLSFAGKFIRQLEDSIDEAGLVVPNTKGTIATGQVKLMIPTKATGIKIPFSVTFANRTDLIKEKIIRGNIGVSYDLDAVFARFKPGL